MEPIVGIDLGTTYSEVAYIIDGNAQVLLEAGEAALPSCVGLNSEDRVVVGHEAFNQAAIAPERTVLSIKRSMGSRETVAMGANRYRPQEISAFILKALKARADKELGRAVRKAVITVPAYFTDAQRQATREAGQLAGLQVIRIINEPTAAALAYESAHQGTQRILVYDLGGGTFDVSIVHIENSVVEVLASTGDNHLGGDDFDAKIVDLLMEHCRNRLGITAAEDPVLSARLRRAAEAAKRELSVRPFVTIEEDHIGLSVGKEKHLHYELSRTDFDELIAEDLNRTMDAVSRALKDAVLTASDIDKIILVGGSTRIPLISQLLEEKLGIAPHGEIDPDLCVALGAAIQAGREMGLNDSSVLLDITPYTFGTAALGELDGLITENLFVPLIKRNTKLPTSRTEAFYTVVDNQRDVLIDVYQGESPNALDNIRIGNYTFKLTPAPSGSTILLQYDLDINGILKLEAVEKKTGRKINAVIENAFAALSEEEMTLSRQRIARVWDDSDGEAAEETHKIEHALPREVAAVIEEAEAALAKASEADREELVDLLEEIKDAVKAGDLGKAETLRQELEDILFYIE
jgi:molecular chaperone DnaK (HSP70)